MAREDSGGAYRGGPNRRLPRARIDELVGAIAFIGERIPITGGGIGSYDPAFDRESRTAKAAVQVIEALVAAASRSCRMSPRDGAL